MALSRSFLEMKKQELTLAASKAIKNRRIYLWVCNHIKAGSYQEPTKLFSNLPENLPPKLSKYFETPEGFGPLYSKDGAIALMEQIIKPF